MNARANEMTMTNPHAEADALDALLADLDALPTPVEESEEVIESVVGELELEAAAPSEDEVHEHRAEELLEEENYLAEIKEGSPEVIEPVAEKPKKAAKPKLTEEEKAAREAARLAERTAKREKKEAEKAAKRAEREAAKKDAPVRKHYATKVERVTDKLGAQLGDYTVLTLSDAALTGDELAAKQAETLAILNEAGVKVQNRMTLLLEFVAGKQANLNEVIGRAFKVLHAEGHITVGEKGNFHQNLLAKPYSVSAARAMGNNTLAAMRDFKVIAKDADGKYVANPESLILMKVNAMLGLK